MTLKSYYLGSEFYHMFIHRNGFHVVHLATQTKGTDEEFDIMLTTFKASVKSLKTISVETNL